MPMNLSSEPPRCCPVCNIAWGEAINKEAHVAACLGEAPVASPKRDESPDGEPANDADDFELQLYPSSRKAGQNGSNKRGDDSEVEGTPFLLRHIYQLVSQSLGNGHTRSAFICHPEVLHIRTTSSFTAGGQGDLTWGCGYRNIQMLFSALRHLDSYRSVLMKHPELAIQSSLEPQPSSQRLSMTHHQEVVQVPNVNAWQRIIEAAWQQGFDGPGAESFSNKLVGKKKWIGTTEAYVAFTSLGIRARIIDFPKPTGPKKSHLGLTDWVRGYFEDTSTAIDAHGACDKLMSSTREVVRITNKMPLYLQHAGHSRTIVGVEIDAQGNGNLLVFDPAKSVPAALKTASSEMAYFGSHTLTGTTPHSRPSSSSSAEPCALSASTSSTSSFKMFSLKRLKGASGSASPRYTGFDLGQASKLLEPFRVSFKSLSRRDQYQILCIENGPSLKLSEWQNRKVLQSTRIE